jgi:hypothetical protein
MRWRLPEPRPRIDRTALSSEKATSTTPSTRIAIRHGADGRASVPFLGRRSHAGHAVATATADDPEQEKGRRMARGTRPRAVDRWRSPDIARIRRAPPVTAALRQAAFWGWSRRRGPRLLRWDASPGSRKAEHEVNKRRRDGACAEHGPRVVERRRHCQPDIAELM